MDRIVTGKIYCLGADIDTDQIIPAEHLVYSMDSKNQESQKYGELALSGVPDGAKGLPEGNIPFVNEGQWQSEFSIIVAGKNFGCGSSREHAPYALKKSGVKLVIALSYARIFFRNSVDGGFYPPIESKEDLSKQLKTGQTVKVDTEENYLEIVESGQRFELKPMGDIREIVEAGGIFAYAKAHNLMK